jgi:hypothetical protein
LARSGNIDAAQQVAVILDGGFVPELERLRPQLRGGGQSDDDATVVLAEWMTELASDTLKQVVALVRSQRPLSFSDLRRFGTAIDAFRAEALAPLRDG